MMVIRRSPVTRHTDSPWLLPIAILPTEMRFFILLTIRITGIENGFLAEAVLLPSAAFISPNNIFVC